MAENSGETPDEVPSEEIERLNMGEPVFNEGGDKLGEIRGFDNAGFYVTMREGYEAMSVEHARSGKEFGEAELMWRCIDCGEMGRIEDGLPDECPNCGESKEALMYWTED
ncbi:hypothetical protein HAPAU_39720 [Halalkalicoccus paucihalophilus]|uniref:DUF7130 domain-containing protein n=1 Tax=Halalkalicoccus paucihalophilus TaxID=1008153 RepID=A0A151A8F5_9EURY|nr:hypothetical protein [Halalkalicoccus paucihalophilus]KYH23893.1 hypothetical protein HAPAU_39720 [Halalkalicoccus paucihalophilus]